MALPELPRDFKEFLKSLTSNGVEYLLVGGYAVAFHGYLRATNDLDIWVKASQENAARIDRALRDFGFQLPDQSLEWFLLPNKMFRMGVPPIRIEILTGISGVEFETAYAEREFVTLDEITVPVISLPRLRQNKRASGRAKDLADLENLPG